MTLVYKIYLNLKYLVGNHASYQYTDMPIKGNASFEKQKLTEFTMGTYTVFATNCLDRIIVWVYDRNVELPQRDHQAELSKRN